MGDYKEVTKDSYDRHADHFAKKFRETYIPSDRSEFSTMQTLMPGKRLLDVGCGAGDHAAYFQRQGLYVRAIDLSSAMVKRAREQGIDARVMDLEQLDFARESFDGIWAMTSLLHIPKKHMAPVRDSLYGILANEGVMHVCLKQGEGEGMITDANLNMKRYFSFWNAEEFENVMHPMFSTLESWEYQRGHSTFLHWFFKKR